MTTSQKKRPERTLCSSFSNSNNEDPAGSAFSWKRCLLLEVPSPWSSDVSTSKHFPSGVSKVLSAVDGTDGEVKLQCILPDPEYSLEGHTRVILFSRPKGMFSKFEKDDYLVPDEIVTSLIESLTTNPDALPSFTEYKQDTAGIRDILVCTHGSHDTCCGTLGYPIYDAIRSRCQSENIPLRVFRVNHIGGHRFAPNIVDLPEGRNWVRLDITRLDDLLLRRQSPSSLRQFHRGWTGLDTPQEQRVEQEILMNEGWSWTERLKSGSILHSDQSGNSATVRIDFSDANGENNGSYEATVHKIDDAPRIECPSGEKAGGWWQFKVMELSKSS